MSNSAIFEVGQYNVREVVLTVFSTISICLALFSTWRVFRNDRRTRLEPYFKTLWIRKSSDILNCMDEIENELLHTKFNIQNKEGLPSTNFDKLSVDAIEYEKFNWDYDRTFLRKLKRLDASLASLRAAASNYYKHLDLTSEYLATDIMLHDTGVYDHFLTDEDEETKEQRTERMKSIARLLKNAREKYGIPDNAPLQTLKISPGYKRDLKHLADTTLREINTSKIHLISLQRDIDFYNFVYSRPEDD